MRWKGIAAGIAVVLCPILGWPSPTLAGRIVPQPSALPVAAAPIAASAEPSKAATPTVSPTLSSPPAPVRPPDAQAPARPAADDRRSKATPFTVDGIALISKKHRVNAKYTPRLVAAEVSSTGAGKVRLQPAAATALTAMFAAAKKAGFRLTVRSAHRSYTSQAAWYRTGDHDLVAPPGASEHQSGLAADLAWLNGTTLVRGTGLGTSKAGAWLRRHAAEFGFIVRYPPGTQAITGISSEPWHFRHVGVAAAKGVASAKSKTLEEYLGLAQ